MSTNKGDGPAFPHEFKFGDGTASRADGMSLRDYFAAKAMAALITTSGGPCIVGALSGAERECAAGAYKIADAMLSARAAAPGATVD